MAEPFMEEIRMVSFNFAPNRWASCDGQLLPIAQNPALGYATLSELHLHNCVRDPRVAKAQPWAGSSERFQR